MAGMIKWVNGFAPMLVDPNPRAYKVLDLPERSLVKASGILSSILNGAAFYEFVTYRTDRNSFSGWVYAGWLEDYIESYPQDCIEIPDQTPDPRDAEQFFYWLGVRQVNICGEACAAFLLGVKLEELLEHWRDQKPSVWRSVFQGSLFRGTNDLELIGIFEMYAQPAVRLTDALLDPLQKRSRYTVTGLQQLLGAGDVIASVRIDRAGRLQPSGALHWVVVTAVTPERTGYGWVELYNPYPNRIERYSWNEFVTSARMPYGVYNG
jgi:hypothetical protein